MKTYIVDSFTEEPFKGNPAGVCITDKQLPDSFMLKIAQELGLSETAFIQATDKTNAWTIRYFSPRMEIPLCGHATLAAARIVLDKTSSDEVVFTTLESVRLPVRRTGDALTMEFPIYGIHPAEVPPELLAALGIDRIVNSAFNKETQILMIEIDDCTTLKILRPDFPALVQSHDAINGVLVTAAADDDFDFHSRYFWPWSGTNEDPVTGGTHTFLAPYWSRKLNRKRLKSFQCSARTGSMEVEVIATTLLITGHATTVFSGECLVSRPD
jgi:PhzF family phenazine biosynthesis protein